MSEESRIDRALAAWDEYEQWFESRRFAASAAPPNAPGKGLYPHPTFNRREAMRRALRAADEQGEAHGGPI